MPDSSSRLISFMGILIIPKTKSRLRLFHDTTIRHSSASSCAWTKIRVGIIYSALQRTTHHTIPPQQAWQNSPCPHIFAIDSRQRRPSRYLFSAKPPQSNPESPGARFGTSTRTEIRQWHYPQKSRGALCRVLGFQIGTVAHTASIPISISQSSFPSSPAFPPCYVVAVLRRGHSQPHSPKPSPPIPHSPNKKALS